MIGHDGVLHLHSMGEYFSAISPSSTDNLLELLAVVLGI
jgi:hypothetical protein